MSVGEAQTLAADLLERLEDTVDLSIRSRLLVGAAQVVGSPETPRSHDLRVRCPKGAVTTGYLGLP